ncbi:tetratricopeptide repeat protein [Aquimarina brevivitae]|uniref:Tetratricopeptide repeat protein n=1 Tax=Aquimarina brevivitae TaxID=323412 RepID=A0A4Q7NTN3_9FLAO|nr:tetratricopeptide repeat protein [Aquimarina brevivitae]RZS90455.1 tetratricopeptide repeat protein [Aquimarina brevivitae]
MKTKFIVVLFLAIGATGFSQKRALRSASKALRSGELDTAIEALNAAEAQLAQADEKEKSEYYFLKGQAYAASAGTSVEKLEKAAEAFLKVAEVEEKFDISKNSKDAQAQLLKLRQSLIEQAIADQNASNYKAASDKLYLGYKTNKKDTVYLYYAAGNAVNGREYDTALDYYNTLLDLGYNGSTEQYVATNKETGEVDVFDSKQARDLTVKAGTHIKPEMRVTASKTGEIAKNVALIYINQGKDELAMKAMEKAKEENPEDSSLMQAEADMYYKLGNIAKYKEIMEQIVANDPENADLLYNLGVSSSKLGDNEQAIAYYEKALEIRPDYTSAQVNIASLILSEEAALVEEMNSLGTSSADYKRYDELNEKRQGIYKRAIPYLEGALNNKPDNVEVVRTLMNIFYQLDDPRAEAMKNKLKSLEGGN